MNSELPKYTPEPDMTPTQIALHALVLLPMTYVMLVLMMCL